MAIQFRRGLAADLDPEQIQTGEPAVCTDTGAVYIKSDKLRRVDNGGVYNPNLLHNWDFRNPVNQRGAASYSYGYGIDRWKLFNMSLTVGSGHVSIAPIVASPATFEQLLEPALADWLFERTVTLSVMLADGAVYSMVITRETYDTEDLIIGDTGFTADIYRTDSQSSVRVISDGTAAAISVAAIKLELGDVSTLAISPLAEYAQQLAICQRYYLMVGVNSNAPGWAWDGEGGKIYCHLPTPVTMRAAPTASIINAGLVFLGSGGLISANMSYEGLEPNGIMFYMPVPDGVTLTLSTTAVWSRFQLTLSAEL